MRYPPMQVITKPIRNSPIPPGVPPTSVNERFSIEDSPFKSDENRQDKPLVMRAAEPNSQLTSRGASRQCMQFVRSTDQLTALDVAILFWQQALAGALQNRHKILQVNFCRVIRWNKIFQSSFKVLGIHCCFMQQTAPHMTANQDRFDIGSGQASRMLEKKRFDISRKRRQANFSLHSAQECETLFRRVGIEQCDVFLGSALPLQVNRQQIGTAGEKKPDHFTPQFSIAHELCDLGEHAVAHATVAGTGAVTELSIRFVHNHGNGTHRLEQV